MLPCILLLVCVFLFLKQNPNESTPILSISLLTYFSLPLNALQFDKIHAMGVLSFCSNSTKGGDSKSGKNDLTSK
jgi:hypothetical protein